MTGCGGARGCAGLCDERGFAVAYRAHRGRLLRLAAASGAGCAEDAVQETFVRAWRACRSFEPRPGQPVEAWLTTILRHVLVDAARSRAVHDRALARLPLPPDTVAPVTDAVLTRLVLVDALATVSDAHRSVVVRAVLRDRAYPDVAAELGIPVGTVKSRMFHALRGLRAALNSAVLNTAA
ncbi:RNA polymerase sigma factor [Pseudonocardia sp.]|uniref:RNA polymerase sigma factor n=1 Tax=Pseudonocardia sp. TaxID=60912 RepID=UPI003D11BF3B